MFTSVVLKDKSLSSRILEDKILKSLVYALALRAESLASALRVESLALRLVSLTPSL